MTRAQELHAARMRAKSTSLNMGRKYKVKRSSAANHAITWPERRAEYLREVGREEKRA